MAEDPDGSGEDADAPPEPKRPMTSAEFLARKRAAQTEAEQAIAQAPVRRRAPKQREQLPGPRSGPEQSPATTSVVPYGAPPSQQFLHEQSVTGGASVFESAEPAPQYVPNVPVDEPKGRWVRLPKRSGFLRRFVIVALVLGAIAWVANGRISTYIDGQLHPITECGALAAIKVDEGDTSAAIRDKLVAANIVLSAAEQSDLDSGVGTALDAAEPGWYVLAPEGDGSLASFQQGPIDGDIAPEIGCVEVVPFRIESGMTTNDVVSELATEDLIGNTTVFRYWLRQRPDEIFDVDEGFQAGNYVLARDLEADDVLAILLDGPEEIAGPLFSITIPEGLTMTEVKSVILDNAEDFDSAEYDEALLSDTLLWEQFPDDLPFRIMEGMLFPARYDVYEGFEGDEQAFLQQMADKFEEVGQQLDIVEKSAALGITPYEAVIVASLIEEEAKVDDDRAMISRVIYNRLDAGIFLGIDATTRYAVNKPPGEPLLQSDLDSDSPWNTRNQANVNLPPTPIAVVGVASLEAALNPVDGTWMNYVLTDEGGVTGAHRFTTTPEEFSAAVAVCADLGYCG